MLTLILLLTLAQTPPAPTGFRVVTPPTNPIITFSPSTHANIAYELEFYEDVGATPMVVLPLGRPVIKDSRITVDMQKRLPELQALKLREGRYHVRLVALTPNGPDRGPLAGPFVIDYPEKGLR